MFGRQLLERVSDGRLVMTSRLRFSTPIGFPGFNLIPQGLIPGFCQGEGRWNDAKLGQWFDPLTCRAIKAIPFPRQNVEDRLIWHYTRDGIFSVKSAYHIAVSLEKRSGLWRALVSWMDKSSWIRVWGANIPPKLKVFVWQILNRILATTEALIEKKVPVPPRCPV
ncbi:unnamed protein product [Linum trigynum]|uniref:Reverse transcriptase zinc-binding domain-containing protein n=1 Tax=Linum trigynum TaxID=586398 RepID=A0AAV2DW07_9ROSI